MRLKPLKTSLVVIFVFLLLFSGTVSAAWSGITQLTSSARNSRWSNNAFDSNGNLHLTYNEWLTPSPNVYREVFYMKLDNNGNKLVSEKQITASDLEDSKCPIAAVDSDDNVHMVFCDFRHGNWETYYVKLDNDGNNLTQEIRLGFSGQDTQPENSPWPVHALDSNDNVHVVWTDSPPDNTTEQQRDLYYAKLDKNGNVLVNSSRLTANASYAVNSALAIDPAGNVHILWRDDIPGNSEIYYTKLDNNGNTLVSPKRRTNAAGDAGSHPWIVVDSGNNVGIVWPDDRTGNRDLYYMKLDNNGTKLIGDIQLTTDSTDASLAGVVTTSTPIDSEDNIHIAWGEIKPSTNAEIYYMKIDNSGNILTSETRLTYTSVHQKGGIHTALDPNGNPHITWYAKDGSDQIYYRYQIGAVTTAVGREYQITNTPGTQTYPYINGNKIVYMSEESPGTSYFDILVYDLGPDGVFNTADDSSRTAAGTPNYDEFYPDINGDLVTYAVGGGTYPHAYTDDANISLFNLSSNVTANISTAPRYQCCPQMYNITVSWHDRRATGDYFDIYVYDLGPDGVHGTGDDGGEFAVATDPVRQQGPQIWGRNLVWWDARNDDGDVYLYDAGPDGRFNTGDDRGEFRVTNDSGKQAGKDVRDHMIVWKDFRDWGTNSEVYGYDMGPDGLFNTTDDRGEFRVTYTDSYKAAAPRVYANIIVWMDKRDGDIDIYIYDLGPDEIFNTTDDGGEMILFNDSYDQGLIEMYDGRIVYADNRDGDYDIYMFELSLVITVCPSGCDYTSIQAAINAASNGDTILVEAGDYNENVDVNKSVNLVGAGARVTTVQAVSSSDHVFDVTESDVNISGFTVTGAIDSGYAGIYLSNSNYSRIEDINASNNDYGIILDSSSGNTIYNNVFNNTNNFGFSGTTYSNDWNTANSSRTNIVGGPYIGGNFWANPSGTGFSETCTDADTDGFCDSGYTLGSGNVDSLPLSPIGCGYTLYTDTALTGNLSGCTGYGLVIGASDVTLDCAGYSIIGAPGVTGIYVSGMNDVTVENCVLERFDKGIIVCDSDNSRIINNAMTDNWGITGIALRFSDYSVIANNSVSSRGVYGIAQYVSNYNTISNNTVTGNANKGIYVTGIIPEEDAGCSYSNISGNVVSNNGYGIYLNYEDNNLVTSNYVYANAQYGIYLNDSWLNYVYDNYLSNANNAYDTGNLSGPNYWNTTKTAGTNIVGGAYLGGNYWSDYTGADTDADGIGDTNLPYNASSDIAVGDGGDWLPLIPPTQYFNLSLNAGWNLVSIPLEQDNWSISVVLDECTGHVVIYTWINGAWEMSTAARDPLTEMDLEHGYWIYMNESCTEELSGTLPLATTIDLITQWNLAGYPSFTTRNITDVLSGCDYTVVYAYINDAWKMSTAARNPLMEMSPGYGYWIYANDACSYDVRNF